MYLHASTKAELLIMVQNEKFAAAIDDGLAAAGVAARQGPLEGVVALITPVVVCVREQIENGRAYLHELVFGDPAEPYRREGLTLSARLEDGITSLLARDERIDAADAATLARVITAIIHISTTAPSTCTAATTPSSRTSANRSKPHWRPTAAPHDRPPPVG